MKRFVLLALILIATVSFIEAKEELIPDYTVMIPMRDGTELPTDLYMPPCLGGQQPPCILMRSPAGRKAYPWRNYAKLAKAGFVIAIQDTRSALDKEGKCLPYWSDGWGREKDGYDAIEWLAKSNFTSGKIGTLGFSALGITQHMLAPTAPPSLKCQYIGVAAGSLYHHAVYLGGQLLKNQIEGWLGLYARDPSIYSYICDQPHYNDFWKSFDTISVAHNVNAPAILYGGWYDVFLQGTLDSFVARQEKGGSGARGKQKLLIGPWTHYWPEEISLGDFEVPENAQEMPEAFSPVRWFDHYLKGVDNKVEELPAVTYYVMGPFDGESSSGNVWRTASRWPLPAEQVPLYMAPEGKLSLGVKPAEEGQTSYTYDPAHPVPTVGGRNLFLESGPKDQSEIEKRSDVVLFTSDPLVEDIEITGHLLATLFFSTDQKDSDVVLRFSDVYPDGKSILISDSIFRVGSLLKSCDENLSAKEKPFEVALDLSSTAIIIPKGHRLRLSVASSNFPRYERSAAKDTAAGNKAPVSHHTVYVGGKYPSRLVLPIVRRGDRWYTEKK